MPTLDRLAPWTTTGVGSLPFRDPAAAAAYTLLAYGLPFCPQLPVLEGDMIAEWLGADPKRCGWSTERDRERPRAWEAFLTELRRHPPRHRVVKLQVTGPATLACALERHDGGRPSRRQALALAEQLAHWLAANVSSQIRHLAALDFDSVLVIDEPALAVFGAGEVERAWEPLRTLAPAWGLHLCCHVPWDTITRAQPDLLSFDLALDRVDEQAAAALAHHLDRGGWVAWGAIRVERSEHGAHAVKRLVAALERIDADPSRSLLTASCGSGRMSEGREREIAVGLFDLAAAMRGGQDSWPTLRIDSPLIARHVSRNATRIKAIQRSDHMAATETVPAQLVTGVDFVAVSTKDLDKAIEFYGQTLGLPMSVHLDERNYAEFETGNLTLSVIDAEKMGMTHQVRGHEIALHVDDVAAARQTLEGRGVEFRGETLDTGVCHMALFNDPDGNPLMLHHRYAPRNVQNAQGQ